MVQRNLQQPPDDQRSLLCFATRNEQKYYGLAAMVFSLFKVLFFALKGVFGVIGEGKEASVQFYTQWVEHVKATVPKEKLLIFNVKEGWKPLCEFLDLPIPNQPFPRTNDTAAMQGNVFRGKFEAFIYILGIPIVTGLFFYHFFGQKLMKFLNWGA